MVRKTILNPADKIGNRIGSRGRLHAASGGVAMIKRVIPVVLVAVALAAAIFYSQYRPVPDRVSGFIEADEIRLGSRVGGRVAKVEIEEGQRVKAGDTLIQLEPFDLLAEQKRAAATLAANEAELKRLEAGLRPEEIAQAQARYEQLQAALDEQVAGPRKEEIDAAAARLRMAEAQQQLARETYRRVSQLATTNAATPQDLDQATESLGVAEGSVAATLEELNLLKAGTREEAIRAAKAQAEEARQAWELAKAGFRKEDVEKAAAARDAAQASLEAIERRIDELTIRSPVDGVVEALDLQPGDLAPAAAPVLSIMDVSRMWVRAYVPENRLDLKVGQKIRLAVDSFPDETFAGEVTFISRQAEFTPSNIQTPEERVKQVFRIKVELREGLDKLRPGMAADVWLSGDAK
jgi:HlyD family secretion protein